MKKNKTSKLFTLGLLLLLATLIAACRPYPVKQIIEIEPHQTAFVVPLEGDSTEQAQFQSVAFLKESQVATKRIVVDVVEHKIGRGWWNIEWIPVARVIVVDRTPVTRQWTEEEGTGTSNSNEAFQVETVETIGFAIGGVVSALVTEENAANFLYYYHGKPLSEVMDTVIRGYIQANLFSRFGTLTLEEARNQKAEIFTAVCDAAVTEFKTQGITIQACGGSDGMIYEDREVQIVVNQAIEAQQQRIIAEAEATSQAIVNNTDIGIANAQATVEVIQAEAEADALRVVGEVLEQNPEIIGYTYAEAYNGTVPNTLVVTTSTNGSNSPFMFLIDGVEVTPAPYAAGGTMATATPNVPATATPQPTLTPTPMTIPTVTATAESDG